MLAAYKERLRVKINGLIGVPFVCIVKIEKAQSIMKIKSVIENAFKNKTGISLYEDDDFFNGYIIQIEDGFVIMACFIYDDKKEQYAYTTKLKIAVRRITEVYVGVDNDDLPDLENFSYPDFQHFYYDKEGLYFAETNRQKVDCRVVSK